MYGGINSHMSIRASEMNIPSIIGCGENLYDRFKSAKKVLIDCHSSCL